MSSSIICRDIIESIRTKVYTSRNLVHNIYKELPKIQFSKYQQEVNALQLNIRDLAHYKTEESPYINKISPGCMSCKNGKWLCIYITTDCNARCRFCPNPIYKSKKVMIDGCDYKGGIEGILSLIKELGIEGVSISGGEPMLEYKKVIGFIERIKEEFPYIYTWVYTNGIIGSSQLYKSLALAGLDEIRFDLAATGYSIKNLESARSSLPNMTIEIPVIPDDLDKIKQCIKTAESIGIDYINLSELMLTPHSIKNIRPDEKIPVVWDPFELRITVPVYGSRHAAYKLMSYAKDLHYAIGINDCSLYSKLNVQVRGWNRNLCLNYKSPWEMPTKSGHLAVLSIFDEECRLSRLKDKIRDFTGVNAGLHIDKDLQCIRLNPVHKDKVIKCKQIMSDNPVLLLLYNTNLNNTVRTLDMAFQIDQKGRYISVIKGLSADSYI